MRRGSAQGVVQVLIVVSAARRQDGVATYGIPDHGTAEVRVGRPGRDEVGGIGRRDVTSGSASVPAKEANEELGA